MFFDDNNIKMITPCLCDSEDQTHEFSEIDAILLNKGLDVAWHVQ